MESGGAGDAAADEAAENGADREPNDDNSHDDEEKSDEEIYCEDDQQDEAEEELESMFKLVSPHKMFIGQPGLGKPSSCVSLTGMEFNPPTQSLMLTTKTVIGDSVTYAVTQLRPSGAKSAAAAGLTALRTRRYRAGLEHHGDLGVASCGRDAPGELVCAGSDRSGRRQGVFRLQALPGTSQPVLAQCCGPAGDRPGQFNRPAGCAVDSGCVYVADRLNHRVQRLALPTLAPLAAVRHPRMFRPSHLAVFSDPHHGRRLLLAAHERGVLAFDLTATEAAATATEFARGPVRRWGGLCVHWGAVLLADQAGNCVRVFRYRPELSGGAGGFGPVQRLPLAPLGLCLPRGLCAHPRLDLLFLAAHDTATAGGGGGEVCVLTARLARAGEEPELEG